MEARTAISCEIRNPHGGSYDPASAPYFSVAKALACVNTACVPVYRDRTEAEIRDIAIVRLVDGIWSDPALVSADGWEIAGCPVNGPAIDSAGGRPVCRLDRSGRTVAVTGQ